MSKGHACGARIAGGQLKGCFVGEQCGDEDSAVAAGLWAAGLAVLDWSSIPVWRGIPVWASQSGGCSTT